MKRHIYLQIILLATSAALLSGCIFGPKCEYSPEHRCAGPEVYENNLHQFAYISTINNAGGSFYIRDPANPFGDHDRFEGSGRLTHEEAYFYRVRPGAYKIHWSTSKWSVSGGGVAMPLSKSFDVKLEAGGIYKVEALALEGKPPSSIFLYKVNKRYEIDPKIGLRDRRPGFEAEFAKASGETYRQLYSERKKFQELINSWSICFGCTQRDY